MTDSLQNRSTVDIRRVREKRADATIELSFGERTEYECPECGETFEIGIHGADRSEPSFGNCSNWDCGAYLKFVSDGSGEDESASQDEQADLSAFAGGEA